MGAKIDLSVIVTAHNEGLIAHKTMRSVFDAVERVREEGYSYEIIVHIDNGDDTTVDYFERYKTRKDVRIFMNHFGDTGPSRNFAVGKAEGKYVAFLDGDDLVSSNWYLEALKILNSKKGVIIVHPEAVLTFGVEQENVLTIQKNSYSLDRDTTILLGENRWCSVLVAKKETLLKIPYKSLGEGYGHEDYVFNLETVEAGIFHEIAKETVLFYRRSDDSRLSSGIQSHVVIPYVKLFSFQNVKKIKTGAKAESKKKTIKDKGYRFYKKIRKNNVLNYFITPLAKLAVKVIDYRSPVLAKKRIPSFVIEEWKNINKIETQLYPYESTLKGVKLYSAEDQVIVGDTFCKIAHSVSHNPDYVFIVPWIVRGGADKVLFNYIKALKRIHKDYSFAVIATVPARNIWAKKLPSYVDFIDFGNVAAGLTPDAQDTLFSRIIIQLNCKRLHIINSEFGYRWARRHQELIKSEYELNVSLFCGEFIPGSNMRGVFTYANPCLFEIFSVVNDVFTDNATIIEKVMEENGFNDKKFKVHYQPIDLKLIEPKKQLVNSNRLKILWAGRVTTTKMPELVASIGRGLDHKSFSLDVYGEKSKEIKDSIFDGIAAIKYRGPFDGFSSIPIEEYDALLYTSMDDGLPNIILEAAAAGLPIIASDDGGVGEFIKDGETGILVEDYLNPDAYIGAIKELLAEPKKGIEYAKNAQNLLKERHSFERFTEDVKRDIA